MEQRTAGRPPKDPKQVANQRFEFKFTGAQVETMGGRSEVLKFVKESITKECVNRAQKPK